MHPVGGMDDAHAVLLLIVHEYIIWERTIGRTKTKTLFANA